MGMEKQGELVTSCGLRGENATQGPDARRDRVNWRLGLRLCEELG